MIECEGRRADILKSAMMTLMYHTGHTTTPDLDAFHADACTVPNVKDPRTFTAYLSQIIAQSNLKNRATPLSV